jgi:hypothetical protein
VSPLEIDQEIETWKRVGLTVLTIKLEGHSDRYYSVDSNGYKPGKPFTYRVVLGSQKT